MRVEDVVHGHNHRKKRIAALTFKSSNSKSSAARFGGNGSGRGGSR